MPEHLAEGGADLQALRHHAWAVVQAAVRWYLFDSRNTPIVDSGRTVSLRHGHTGSGAALERRLHFLHAVHAFTTRRIYTRQPRRAIGLRTALRLAGFTGLGVVTA